MDYRVLAVLVHFGFGLSSCSDVLRREYHYVNLTMNWTHAQRYCREKYTDLATFESMDDISILNRPNMTTSLVWIGLSDDPKSWRGTMGHDANSWRWSATGQTSTTGYQNWEPGQPNKFRRMETCVVVNYNGRWDDIPCSTGRYFVCYNALNPAGQVKYTLIKRSKPWRDTQAYCREHHTDLAMIESDEENKQLISIKSTYTVWIGLYRVPWRWSDGSSSSFKNWEGGQPSNTQGLENCAAEMSNHFWHDVKCEWRLSVLCHQDIKVKKMTMVRVKIQTHANLSDPAIQAQILMQLEAVLKNKTSLNDVNLRWTIPPKKEETKGGNAEDGCVKP